MEGKENEREKERQKEEGKEEEEQHRQESRSDPEGEPQQQEARSQKSSEKEKGSEKGSDKEKKSEGKEKERKYVDLKDLPPRIRGHHTDSFRAVPLVTNHFGVHLKEIKKIHIYSIKYEPAIEAKNSKLRMMKLTDNSKAIEKVIPDPVFTGYNIYSTEEPRKE